MTVEDMRAYLARAVGPTREQAWETLTRYTKSEALLRHALAVEARRRAYARRFGEDEELWGIVALLHDFDYEMHPTLDQHPQDGAPILRELGYPEVVVARCSRTPSTSALPRETPLEQHAVRLRRAGRLRARLRPRAAGRARRARAAVGEEEAQAAVVRGRRHRDDVYEGAEPLGVDLDDHIEVVIDALGRSPAELGLRRPDSRAPPARSATAARANRRCQAPLR